MIFIKYWKIGKCIIKYIVLFYFFLSFISEFIFVERKLGYGRLEERHELTSSRRRLNRRFLSNDYGRDRWQVMNRVSDSSYHWQMTNDEQFATMIIYVDWEQNTIRRAHEKLLWHA